MPIHFVGDGARLILQLFHHRLHGQKILGLRPLLIHPSDEMACADVVEVVVEDVVVADVAFGINHRIGIGLTILADVLTTIFKIGVEHAFEFDAHHVAPFGFRREIEQIALRHALHLRVGEPFAIVLIGHLIQNEGAVDEEIVEVNITGFARAEVA